ncbi:hypothetical protein [Gaetbulibacter sp. NE]|uniref:hypothetical protein n=1 Tax=Gaetbulibacter sp. NE TaxID=2982307 RepID=UPI0021CFCD2D|nr:hypothetical protein [Gaetbulibacter sp. NE]
MRKYILIITFLFTSSSIFSQINFEKGYIINSSSGKILCFIKNEGWVNSPDKILYKLDMSSDKVFEGDLSNIKEFGFKSNVKYVNRLVNVDLSSNLINKLSKNREPNFVLKQVFLKQLIDGKANLYEYRSSKVTRYFISLSLDEIIPLIYKRYKVNVTQIAENVSFKSQLYENLKCSSGELSTLRKMDYYYKDLMEYVGAYNLCETGENIELIDLNRKNQFLLNVKAGAFLSTMSVDYRASGFTANVNSGKFDNRFSPRFGLELEYMLPFNKNKWSLFVEPSYQSFNSSGVTDLNGTLNSQDINIEYSFVEIPVGVRHYMYLSNKDSRLFFNLAYVVVADFGGELEYSENLNLDIKSRPNLLFGFGYNLNKVSLEFRIATSRNIVSEYSSYSTDYKNIGIVFGYHIL